MDWLHSYASLRDHPKTKKFCRLLSVKTPEAVGLLHCLWWWSMDYAPDGDLTDVEPDVIADGAGWDGDPDEFIAALVKANKEKGGYGFLEERGGRLLIHDHQEYIGAYMSQRAKDAQRKREEREKARQASDVQGTGDGHHDTEAASGSVSNGRPTDIHAPSTGRPSDGGRTASRDARALTEEREKREEKEPPLPPQPVDNSQSGEVASDHQEPAARPLAPASAPDKAVACASDGVEACAPGTCDGSECQARSFPASAFAPLHRVLLKSQHPDQWKEIGTHGDLDQLLAAYAAHVCAACQADLGEFGRPQLDELCEKAVCLAVESLDGSADVKAVMRSRLTSHFGLLKLIGDRRLEELRRSKRGRRVKAEPRRIADCLPSTATEEACS